MFIVRMDWEQLYTYCSNGPIIGMDRIAKGTGRMEGLGIVAIVSESQHGKALSRQTTNRLLPHLVPSWTAGVFLAHSSRCFHLASSCCSLESSSSPCSSIEVATRAELTPHRVHGPSRLRPPPRRTKCFRHSPWIRHVPQPRCRPGLRGARSWAEEACGHGRECLVGNLGDGIWSWVVELVWKRWRDTTGESTPSMRERCWNRLEDIDIVPMDGVQPSPTVPHSLLVANPQVIRGNSVTAMELLDNMRH